MLLRGRAARPADLLLWLLVGFAAIIGHMFSLFLKFKGGKGVATSTAWCLGLFPIRRCQDWLAAVVFLLVFKISRYVESCFDGRASRFRSRI